jgi:hypothetical protein
MAKSPKPKIAPPVPVDEQSQNFRKGNSEIGFRIKKGRMSFLSRKVLNSLTYRAQTMGIEGKGLYRSKFGNMMIPEDLKHENYWWIELSDVVKDARFNSRDYTMVKEYLEELQRVLVIRETSGYYGSDQLLGSVKIINTLGPGTRRGGKLLLGWQFPSETEDKILAPDIYTRLSVYFQGLLRTEQALVLYEICKRYSTNPSNLTARKHWHLWFEQMLGQEIGTEKPEYKYFKRNVVTPAILEVNTVTDIHVELIEHKKGRWVEDLQFIVKPKAQQQLVLPEEPAIDGALMTRLEDLGLNSREAEKLCASHTNDFIRETLFIVEERMKSTTLPPLASPVAFFKSALKGEYAKTTKPKRLSTLKASPEAAPENEAGKAREQLIHQTREKFTGLDEDTKSNLLSEFALTLKPPLASSFAKTGMKTRLVQAAFYDWFALQ